MGDYPAGVDGDILIFLREDRREQESLIDKEVRNRYPGYVDFRIEFGNISTREEGGAL